MHFFLHSYDIKHDFQFEILRTVNTKNLNFVHLAKNYDMLCFKDSLLLCFKHYYSPAAILLHLVTKFVIMPDWSGFCFGYIP